MTTYKKLLILKLSGIQEWYNEKEMIISKEMMEDDWFACFYTCEFFGDKKYTLRGYYENGRINWEQEYQNNLKHGKYINYYRDNGSKCYENDYRHGLKHGKEIMWNGGFILRERHYEDGECVKQVKWT